MKKMIFEYKGKTCRAQLFMEFETMYASFYEYFSNRIIFKKRYLETRMIKIRGDLKESIMEVFDKVATFIDIEEMYQKKNEKFEKLLDKLNNICYNIFVIKKK